MFSHVMIGSNDIAQSKKFYDALFVAMGGKPGDEDARGRLAYTHNGGRFMVSKPIDGKPASHANGGTIGFSMSGPEQVDAWHKAGVVNGGTSIEERTRQACAKAPLASYISRIFVIPMATNCARSIANRLPEQSPTGTECPTRNLGDRSPR
jgi:hypothetical protein